MYVWQPLHIPTTSAYSKCFSLEHTWPGPKRGFPSITHNHKQNPSHDCHTAIRTLLLLSLQSQLNSKIFLVRSTSTKDGARLDIVASCFWNGRSYFDVKHTLVLNTLRCNLKRFIDPLMDNAVQLITQFLYLSPFSTVVSAIFFHMNMSPHFFQFIIATFSFQF